MALATVDNERARTELGMAVSIQAQAKAVFAGGALGYLQLSARLTLEARGHADRAIAIIKGLPDPDRVRVQLERTREIIERARQRIEECDHERARAMLRIGIEMQGRAEAAFGEGRFLAALQLTMSARERGLRALQLCNAGESLDETVASALQRTDDLLSRVHERVDPSDHERARQLLANADNQQARAKTEAQAGHPGVALRFTRMAREQAQRAERIVSGQARR